MVKNHDACNHKDSPHALYQPRTLICNAIAVQLPTRQRADQNSFRPLAVKTTGIFRFVHWQYKIWCTQCQMTV